MLRSTWFLAAASWRSIDYLVSALKMQMRKTIVTTMHPRKVLLCIRWYMEEEKSDEKELVFRAINQVPNEPY
ncbi:MAG: hypothetical protein NTW14_13330 [bacterium]|nr:hypothetical protein [bacterium]